MTSIHAFVSMKMGGVYNGGFVSILNQHFLVQKCNFLDATASFSIYPCRPVSELVSELVIYSFRLSDVLASFRSILEID